MLSDVPGISGALFDSGSSLAPARSWPGWRRRRTYVRSEGVWCREILSLLCSVLPSFTFLLLPAGFSWMREFPCSPSPSDVLEDFVPHPCLCLTVSPISHTLQLTYHIFRLLSLAFRQAGFLDAERNLFSSSPHELLPSALAFPLLLTSLLCRWSSRAMLTALQPGSGFPCPPHWCSRTLPFPKCCGSQHPCLHPA